MSRLTRDGTAEPACRETKFSGANADKETLIFPVKLTTSRIGNLSRLIHICYIRDHTNVVQEGGLSCANDKNKSYERFIHTLNIY